MHEKKIVRVVLILFLVFLKLPGTGQHIDIDKKGIQPLIDEWNFANNEHSANAFKNVYADNLLFYTQQVTRDEAIAFKQKMFDQKPAFQQRISSDINFTPYSTGVIKCEFTKEAFEQSQWKKYDAYLLVSYEQNRFQIVGESDVATDKTLNFSLDIGEPMQLGTSEAVTFDSSAVGTSAPSQPMTNSGENTGQITNASALIAYVLSDTPILVRRDYLFLLIGILLAGGLMIFVADKLAHRRRTKATPKRSAAENAIITRKKRSKFESFAVTLFDPLYFSIRKYKTKKVMAGHEDELEYLPHLQVTFTHKDVQRIMAVHCTFREHIPADQVEIVSPIELQRHKHFQEEYNIELYYIVGVGGHPDDPKELYLIPSDMLPTNTISKSALSTFRKSGMFFYNNTAKKLQ